MTVLVYSIYTSTYQTKAIQSRTEPLHAELNHYSTLLERGKLDQSPYPCRVIPLLTSALVYSGIKRNEISAKESERMRQTLSNFVRATMKVVDVFIYGPEMCTVLYCIYSHLACRYAPCVPEDHLPYPRSIMFWNSLNF